MPVTMKWEGGSAPPKSQNYGSPPPPLKKKNKNKTGVIMGQFHGARKGQGGVFNRRLPEEGMSTISKNNKINFLKWFYRHTCFREKHTYIHTQTKRAQMCEKVI